MICRPITIINKLGLHARATNKLVTTASRFDSKITLKAKGREVDARNIMQVMMLAASQGTEVELAADGPDEQEAIDALVALIDDYFGEGE
ncbi:MULTISPECIES: HPr family phosphocarrier protein [Marinobacter]|jgi:phosphocarrier protein|uniref:HPr family phosphocarrier protein n=1 Tax=Marinobacter vinifirmus TaxID=355591 RepID=A0A259W5P4_9GAMM|nr:MULTISPECIES: HPr family phosphocarrier protein [Marinobacter]ERP90591.1 phosphocarrier protein HPr [Marinobacter sp. ES-1]KRW81944.1 phosphocarrier protein HPr [Marinobacter sp. P4B1]MCE0760391.1 HPr family phosphocarrier protein [Marinobacter sp. G11]OZC37911.1 phosphocarrier protein HPr [Marinobacter vinifirmus]TVT35470.1 MAG: HPr family phosphocarrier protein [Marinobacter vinifirmus]|tara:strand:+ start:2545 stop:2814 length:270 start_codon:yes stop_codon:yes gene_type:complete